uniref:Venom polypeptide n=1 Tax=Dolopus genitalis TaxID=2488630 RepID=A0A3G5BIC6_DOLGE|nr:venom polypeptide [Dolopus genitalis]
MKAFSVLIFICLAAAITAYEQYIGNARHPDHPGKCYHKDTNYAIAIGEVYRPVQADTCAKYTCRDDFVIRINHCPRYMVGEGCTVSRDENQPYPKCCAVLHCVDRDGKSEDRPTGYDS